MKRTIWKTLAVIAVFSIGASINSSCGGSHIDENTPPSGEIWETVNNLVAEVSQLKKDNEQMKEEIRQLRENNGNTESDGSDILAEVEQLKKDNELIKEEIRQLREDNENTEINGDDRLIDGLYFSRTGYVSSKSKRWSSDSYDYTYEYDEQGRIQKQTMTMYVDGLTYSNGTTVYNYSGKTVTIISTTTYTNPEKEGYTSTTIYEYY